MLGELKKKNLLLLVILILALCVALPVLAMATTAATVTVGSTETAAASGDSITIPVSISDNPGITTYGFTITYDSSNLTLDSISKSGGLCTSGTFIGNTDTAGTAYVSWLDGTADMTENDDLFYLNFTVNESASAGNYTVICALKEGIAANCKNYARENVPVTFESGTIQVEATTPEDFSGSVVVAPLADNSAEPLTTLYDSYSVSYVEGTAAITATSLRSHTNGNGDDGYWVGVGLEIPAETTYSDIQIGTAADSLAEAGMTAADFTDNGTDYMAIYVSADNTDQVRTFYVSFDGGTTVYSITIDCTNVTLYQENPAIPSFSGSVVVAPLSDNSAEPLTTLYDSYSVSYVDGTATITAINLRSHTNANSVDGYWVGAGLDIPSGTTYSDIQFGTASDSLASAGMTAADFTDNGMEYMAVYVKADNAEQVRTFYVSFDGGTTVYSIAIDCSNVTLYEENEDTTINLADFTDGVYAITEGGEYQLGADATGTIEISTTDAVTIIGNGVDTSANSQLTINYTVSDADLTIQNVWLLINSFSWNYNIINFTGTNNELTISGTNLLEVSKYLSSAIIHVPYDADITIDGDGTLYMYKYTGGSGIGADCGEANGEITIAGSDILIKGSKTGPLIGNDTGGNATQEAQMGDINITGGNITLIPKAKGAGIGGGWQSIGNDVYLSGGNLTVISDFTAGIGAGGDKYYDNPDLSVWGNMYFSGGSLRAVRTENTYSYNGDSATQTVDDSLVTPNRYNNDTDKVPVYKLAFDTDMLATATDDFTVKIDSSADTYYSGGPHLYYYSESISSTMANFGLATEENGYLDTNLYFYLTGKDHTLDVNGEAFNATWDSATSSFSVAAAPAHLWTGSGTAADPYQITSADGLVALATYTNEGNTTKDVYWQLANNIDLSTVCGESLGSWTPIGNKQISSSDDVTGYAFLGDFDGNGKDIQNLYVLSASGYLGLFGAIGGNDNHDGTDGYGTVHDFDLYGYVINTLQSGGADFVGGVCGKLYAGGTISDVTNHASVLAPCVYNVGGIVGFAGTNVLIGTSESGSRYTNDPSGDNTYVLRCGNEAMVIGYNKVGGIVGENAAQVMYCYNNGWIIPHLSGSGGGTGGIAGRNGNNNVAYEEGTIAYCYNAGKITDNGYSWTWNDGTSNADNSWKRNSDTKWIGGITGFNNNKSIIRNCYVNEFFTEQQTSYLNNKNPIVGHLDNNNTYKQVQNAYSLDTLWYNSSAYDAERGTPLTEEQFKVTTYGSGDILTLIGTAFMVDNTNINSGYPILRWQAGESIPSVTSISIETEPTKVNYDDTEVFDPTGMVIWAVYSDGSKAVVTDYTYSTDPLIAGTTSIDITYGGLTVTQAITVSSLSLSGIAITTNPTNLVYAADETFDPTGMVVIATYNDNAFTNKEVTYDATGEAGYTYSIDETGLLSVTYTEDEVTQIATLQLTFLSSNSPTTLEDVYQLDSADDMVWFANQVNIGVNLSINGILTQDIDASSVEWEPIGSNKMKYSGHFDGNNKKITINVTGTDNYSGLFGYLYADGSIENLTVDGVVSGGNNTAGIIGYLNGATISGCTNAATVNGNQYTGGIVGNSTGEANIIDCINTGVITSFTHTVGGIVGNGGLTGLIENCSNDGTISGQNKVGGIVGNDYSTATLSKCYNSGSVTGTSDDTTPSAATNCAGGIAGFVNKAATIDQCYNSGTISGGVVNIGGIAGYLNNANSIVTNCYNLGTVNSSSIYAQASVGGVIGIIKYSGASVQNCYNAGEIIAAMTSSSYVAGVIGNAAGLTNVTNNYYLNTTADLASGFTTSTSSNAMAKTSSAMSSAYFVTLLGSAYIEGDIYPALSWQDITIGSDDVTVEDGGTVEIGSEQGGNRIVLDSDLVTEMTGTNNISLELTTQNGTFEFDSESTAEILEAAGNSSVTFKATLLTESSDSGIQELIDGGNMVFDFSLTANGSSIFTSASSGSVTIRIPYTMDFKTIDNIKIYYINSEGEKTQITPVTYEDGYLVFSVTHFSTYSIEYDGLNIWADFNNDTVDFNGNDQITVKIYAKNNVETTYGSYQAEINFNSSLLTFNSDESSIGEGTSNIELYSSGIVRIGYASEESVEQSLNTEGTLLATLVFDVNTGITDSITGTICIGDASFGASGYSEDQSASIGADLSYTLHNIKLTFQAGTGSTLSKTYAYVKYNQPGIFTDDTYTTNMDVPVPTARTGYRLAADTDDEPLWIDSSSIEYTSDEIVASSFSASDTFTVQAVMQYTVAFYDSTGTQIESTQAVDINACATSPDDPTLTGYLFRGWYIVTTASDDYDGSSTLYDKATIDATPVTTGIIYKAYFDIPSFNVTVPDCVNIIEGITDDQVTYGVDVIFNIDSESADGYVVMVTYKVDGGEQCELTADSGAYTLPGTEITGEITILVSQVVDGEVTFVGHDEYMGAASGYKVLLLESNYDSMDRDTMSYIFDTDTDLFYSEEYGAYVAFVSANETTISALEKIALDKTASTTVVNYDGDVNNANSVTTLDAQIIYDLLNSKDVNGITDLMRFCADYDGNKVVTTNDAYAIICQIFNITE